MDIPKNLVVLSDIALKAGAAIMAIYDGAVEVRAKQDNTPVTDADIAAEAVILEALAASDPDTPVIAEEAVAAGQTPHASARFYLVDPLDGTREFISRNGEFTVNIALIENGTPVMGAVYAPALSRLFCGAVGHGAAQTEIEPDGDIREISWRALRAAPVPDGAKRIVASRSHRDERTEDWLAEQQVAEIVAAGSSLKFCLIAAGEADLYPRFGRTMEWDTAAGHAVLAAAGGQVVTEDGAALAYGKAERGFDNPAFIARGA